MCLFNNKETKIKPSNTTLLGGRFHGNNGLTHYLGYFNTVDVLKSKNQADSPIATRQRGSNMGQMSHETDDLFLKVEKAFQAGVDPLAGLLDDAPISSQTRAASEQRQFGFHAEPANAGGDRPFGYHANTAPTPLALGNAMLIPVPVAMAASGKLEDRNINLIPMGPNSDFIQDYVNALEPEDWDSQSKGLLSFSTRGGGEVKVFKGFDDGLYDVVMAESASLIESVIDKVDAQKRPVINSELYAQLDKLYPNWVWLLFCFSEADSGKAGGALITYTSQYPDLIILPGLDGHSGEVETGDVDVDHTIILGSDAFTAAGVSRNHWVRANAPWLPESIIGSIIKDPMPQGDFLFLAAEVEAGIFNCLRDLPPGWAEVYGKDSIPAPRYFGDTMRRWSKPVRR
jgi:hypothetical protein